MAAQRYEISLGVYNTNEIPNYFTFCCGRRDLLCNHGNGDLFTCEDMFSRGSSPVISLVFI